MEFLLFLCAALSALTGAIGGARAPGIAVQIERVSDSARVAVPHAARAVSAIVQAQRLPPVRATRAMTVVQPLVLAAAMPLFGNRRRE